MATLLKSRICCKGNIHPSHADRLFRNTRLSMMISRVGFVQQYSTDRVLPVVTATTVSGVDDHLCLPY